MFIQTIKFLWPFLKEMILGDKTLKEALRHHFWRVVLMGLIILSIALNFLTIPRLLAISYDHVELKRRYAELVKQRWPQADVEGPPDREISGAAEAAELPKPLDPAAEQYRQSKEFFDRLKAQEGRK